MFYLTFLFFLRLLCKFDFIKNSYYQICLTLKFCKDTNDTSLPKEIINAADTFFQTFDIKESQREYIVYPSNSVNGVTSVPIFFQLGIHQDTMFLVN